MSNTVKDLSKVDTVIMAENGEAGQSKDCFGKNAKHKIIPVPIGTIVRDTEGNILADLDQPGMMFIGARGGAGGHGNAFFKSDVNQAPKICEYGGEGETCQYVLEMKSMAHVGLVSCTDTSQGSMPFIGFDFHTTYLIVNPSELNDNRYLFRLGSPMRVKVPY